MQESGNISISATEAHYQNHLATIYSWISGDFEEKSAEQYKILAEHGLSPKTTGIAIDLGSAHGIHSMALAKCGYSVIAVDFNSHLLAELRENMLGWGVHTICGDIRHVQEYSSIVMPEIIVCGGDTIMHLNNDKEVEHFMDAISHSLPVGGKLLLSFRDYTTALTGNARFIPVKSDESRIFTCILDYEEERVRVTDLLYQKRGTEWIQHISSYYKLRIEPLQLKRHIEKSGLKIDHLFNHNSMIYILATKGN